MADNNEGRPTDSGARAKFLTPPVWTVETKYADWKFEVDLWRKFTLTEKKTQGFAIYSSLPHHNDSHDKIRLSLQNREINLENDSAVDDIFKVLDKYYKKDDISSMFEAWTAFKTFTRGESSIHQFLNEYDKQISLLKKQDITLPQVVIALQLLDCANLDQKERQIIMTAVDYSKKDTLYEQMKAALNKFLGEQCLLGGQNKNIKTEPIFVTQGEHEEANFTRSRFYRGRGARAQWRGRQRITTPRGSFNFKGRGRGRYNPKDESGNFMKCNTCESTMHFRRDCPHTEQEYAMAADGSEQAYKIEISQKDKEVFMLETIHSAVLDSACSKTVAGEQWKELYLSSLSEQEKSKIKMYPSNTTFKFGSGDKLTSKKCMEIPCIIGGRHSTIKSEIVASDIPLLLSKPDMKRLGFKINLENDTLEVNGQSIDLDTTSTGHYFIPLKECEIEVQNVNIVNDVVDNKEKEKIIKKLHRQFGHPSVKSLKAILQNAEVIDKQSQKVIEDITQNCEICKRYKKTPARPVVALPLATQFNEAVAMDLKTLVNGSIYIIHFIDMHSRFTKSKIIRRKTPKTIIDSIAIEWIAAGFGPPKKFLIDNGGEFDNEAYKELGEQFNVEVCATAAYSPWSNGLCERNHQVVDVCVQKMLEDDPDMNIEVALAWAVNAKNSMTNHLGFSPIQIVVGSNPNLPSVLTNKLPAQEVEITNASVARHLNAMHAARKAFTQADASERVKRALRHNVRVNEENFVTGEKVFYKRDDSNRWRGPGKVIGQDGKVLFVRHGGQLVRVSTCRALKTESINNSKTFSKEKNSNKPDHVSVHPEQYIEFQGEDNSDHEYPTNDLQIRREQNKEDDIATSTLHLENNSEDTQTPGAENGNNNRDVTQIQEIKMPRVHERIRYRNEENEVWQYVQITGKGGKKTGKNQSYFNVLNEKNGSRFGIHLDKVEFEILDKNTDETIQENENTEQNVNISTVPINEHLKPEIIEAKEKEIENWKSFNVFNEVPDRGQKTISTRWVITKKINEGEEIVKARLVVRGFEEDENKQTDSPTAAKSTLRLVAALAANEKWKLETIDIKAAFLQGKDVEREIYVRAPEDFKEEGVIWKLNKVAYGLEDASRNWFMSVKEELLKLKCEQSELDNALFRWYDKGSLQGVFVMHVDDFLFAGTDLFNKCVIKPISVKYKVGKRVAQNFRYVGLNIQQQKDGSISIDQEEYGSELKEIRLENGRKSDKQSSLKETEAEALKSLAGQLNWIATQTRPDISYDALELNMCKQNPTVENIIRANKSIKQVQQNSSHIFFPHLGKKEDLYLKVYSDAAWGNLPDGISSAQGHIIFLCGKEGNACPLSWSSNKIRRKVSSTLAAETLSLYEACDEAIYLNALISETMFNSKVPKLKISGFVDNKSLHENIHSTKQVYEKRLRINIAEIRRMLNENDVSSVKWITSKSQISDVLTKRGVDPAYILEIIQNGHLE